MKTVRSLLLDLMVVSLTIFGFVSVSYAGGAATGGGSICTTAAVNNGHPMLLDLALSNLPNLIDQAYTGTRLRDTKVAEALNAGPINLHQNRAYKYALARIKAWGHKPGSKYSMALVKEGLKSIQFLITPLRIKHLSRIYLPPRSICQKANLQTAILFDNGFLYISLPVWNKLGLLSQAGLLIHESLRNVQILQQLDGTDADLERLTAKILMPYDGATQMDAQPFFAKYISNGSRSEKAEVSKECSQLTDALTKYPALKTYTLPSDVHTICTANFSLNGDIKSVEKSLSKLSDGIGRALHSKTFQALGNGAFDNLTALAINMNNTSDALADEILRRTVLYNGTNAATVLNGATQMDAQPFFAKYISNGSRSDFLHPAYMAKICVKLSNAINKISSLKNDISTSDLHTICATKFARIKNILAATKSLNDTAKSLVTAQGKLSPTDPHNDYIAKLIGKVEMAAFRSQNIVMARALYKQTDAVTGLRGVPYAFNSYVSTCRDLRQFVSKYSNESTLKSVLPDLQTACSASTPQEVVSVNEANALVKVADELNKIVESSPLPFTPFMMKISDMSVNLSLLANELGGVVIDNESYSVRDAITGLSGVVDSVATDAIRRYLNGEPLSYSPTVEARDERIIQQYIQVQREENKQFLAGGM